MDSASTGGEPLDLERLAASLRADSADLNTFFGPLAVKLAGALGDRVTVEYERGLLRRSERVQGVAAEFGEQRFELKRERGRLTCRILHRVRGIVLRTEEVGFDVWLRRFVQQLGEEARSSASTRAALNDLLT
jgi:hypothetical protein